VERLDNDRIRVTARLPVEDLGELFGVELHTEDVETVAGLLAQALGRVPIPGASATVGNLTLEAEGTTGRRNRIDAVLVTRQQHRPDDNHHAETRHPDNRHAENRHAEARHEERQHADA
jgi:CBS domain containing-hemolysin-like protein